MEGGWMYECRIYKFEELRKYIEEIECIEVSRRYERKEWIFIWGTIKLILGSENGFEYGI